MLTNFINGAFAPQTSLPSIDVIDPASGERIAAIPDSDTVAVDRAIASARHAQRHWGGLPPNERAGYLRRVAAGIREQADELARAVVSEQGKVLGLAIGEVNFAADYLDYMAEWARRIEGEIITSDRPRENIFLFRQPIGVVVGILPWNFPFFLIARKVAPALVTGNTIVVKPSEETPLSADLFARIVQACELPPGVFNLVHGRGPTVGSALSAHRDVGMISFTGSVETGSRIMSLAARNVTKVNLELGGKAPVIVMDDADLELAVGAIKAGRLLNAGQACNCPERIYVQRGVLEPFTEALAASMRSASFGHPLAAPAVDMGPLVSATHARKVSGMVERAVAAGARLVTGGHMVVRDGGHYFEPTVLADCRQETEIVQQEVFGPVLPIDGFDTLEEAISRANDSRYGLTSSIYTTNVATAMHACRELRFGETYVNREHFEAMQGFHAGVRQSGLGGADGKHGLYENTAHHVVYLQA